MSNEWFDNGEFPPAGTRCMVEHEGRWGETYIVGMSEYGSCVYSLMGWRGIDHPYDGISDKSCFKPIKSEREETIERMCSLVDANSVYTVNGICADLYDAGLRFKEGE